VHVNDGASSLYVVVLANQILHVILVSFSLIQFGLYNMGVGTGFLVVGVFLQFKGF